MDDTNVMEPPARAQWDTLVAEFTAVEAIPIDDSNDDIIERAGELITEIMAMPVPDAAAVRWKLDYLLTPLRGSTGSYSADYVAQTVADYRRFLGGPPASDFDRASMTFEGVDLPFNHTNEDWARSNLPQVRLAALLMRDDDVELTERMKKIVDAGCAPELLEGISSTREHLLGILHVLEGALTRCFVALERLGFTPDDPPTEHRVQ